MKHPNPIATTVSAALLLAGAGPVSALSGDQEGACGAILCLVGGSGVAECAGYLARYFAITASTPQELLNRRLDFLNLCPASDLPADIRPLIASYGAQCQPPTLVSYLNAQIQWCEARNLDGTADCRPTGEEWRICAPFYSSGFTAYEAPRLDAHCVKQTDADGYQTERCTYTWAEAGSPPPPADPTPTAEVQPAPTGSAIRGFTPSALAIQGG
jgi:hypothetical protein